MPKFDDDYSRYFEDKKQSKWKRYFYSIIGAEISATTQFFDQCRQVAPLTHDTGHLLNFVRCKSKSIDPSVGSIPNHHDQHERRIALLFNGNFNYLSDIEHELSQLKFKLSRHTRVFLVLYNPYLRFLYRIMDWLGLRSAPFPTTFMTMSDLQNLARLSGYEVVRTRPSVFFPLALPVLSTIINQICPAVPLIRHLAFVWVVVLRPIIPETRKPSLSIIIPARNEAGNIEDSLKRLPTFAEPDIEAIFVEGGSGDETWLRIKHLEEQPPPSIRIKAFQQKGKGKNDAVRVGFDQASHEIVTILDADLTMPPELLSRFYDAYCAGLGDFINGNRLLYQMEKDAMRPLNRIGNIFFAKILSWVLDFKIGDSLCGTKMLTLHDYRRIKEWRAHFGDFDPFGDFELLFASSELALGVQDLPVRYLARSYGDTQIHRFRDGLKLKRMTFLGLFRIRLGKTN